MKSYYEHSGITIYHGDALEVLPTLSGIAGVVTDPPYSSGGAFRGDRTNSTLAKYISTGSAAAQRLDDFTGDNRDQRAFMAWASLWFATARNVSVPGAVVASFIDWRQLPTLTDAMQVGGWVWRGIAPWHKTTARPRAGGFSSACEYLLWGTNGPMRSDHEVYGPGIFTSAIEGKGREHIAQKPESVMRWAIQVVPPIGAVCDPFMGSGTTLRAAKDLGYPAIGIEISERYCEIAAKRLEQTTLAQVAT